MQCPGSVAGASASGATGGTAPNGQVCPAGLYFASVDPNAGNNWHHLSGIGKLQWNHIINDKSAMSDPYRGELQPVHLRAADVRPEQRRVPECERVRHQLSPERREGVRRFVVPGVSVRRGLAAAADSDKNGTLHECTQDIEDFYGDRRSNMYTGGIDYSNAPNANWSYKIGLGNEVDRNLQHYYNLNKFNGDGTYPQNSTWSEFPTSIPSRLRGASFNVGRFVLQPGLRFQMEHYAYPGGGKTVRALDNTFAERTAWTPTTCCASRTGQPPALSARRTSTASAATYNPDKNGQAFDPQINHSADLMLERNWATEQRSDSAMWYTRRRTTTSSTRR